MQNIIELANAKNYDALESLGFEGIDASLEISLEEYGLAVKANHSEVDNHFVLFKNSYGLWDWAQGTETNLTSAFNDWIDKPAFLSFVGCDETEWLKCSLATKLSDLVGYYGTDNIFGGC